MLKIRFVPKNVVNDFKINTRNETTLKLARYVSNNFGKTYKTSMLFEEWPCYSTSQRLIKDKMRM